MTVSTDFPLQRIREPSGAQQQQLATMATNNSSNSRSIPDSSAGDDDDDLHVFNSNNPDDGEAAHIAVRPSYPDEDTRPTSTKEIYGWYSYAWASEVFAICAIGSFIPILLEQLAREKGHLEGAPDIPCISSETVDPSSPSSANLSLLMGRDGGKSAVCIVELLGWSVNTASFVMYTFSLSVMFQALVIISMSGAADHGRYRKLFLLIFAYVGSIACIFMIFVSPDLVLLASILSQIANVAFGASYVLMNAFLPVMVRWHPIVRASTLSTSSLPEDELYDDVGEEETSLLGTTSSNTVKRLSGSKLTPAMELSTRISSYGIAIGYSAGVLLQMFCIYVVSQSGSTTKSLQVAIFSVGIWWFVFTIPSAITLRPRPGPPLPGIAQGKFWWLEYIAYSWAGLFKTIRQASKLKDVALFLIAWFMVSDGVATIASSAIVFAKTNLGMAPKELAVIGVIMPISGVIGAFSWPRISAKAGWSVGQTIAICIAMFVAIPVYGLLGLIESVKNAGFGLTRPEEMYGLAIWFGFVLGGQGGYCRSLYSEILPRGSEAAFFALYAITDKGSSIFGPTIVGIITDRWGDIRLSFWFILCLLLVPLPFLYCVDVNRGKLAAEEFVKNEDARRAVENGGLNGHSNGDATRTYHDDLLAE